MKRANNPNLLILETAVHRLGSLADEFVFLGGCATGLLLTDAAAPPIRQTVDVDVIVQVLSKAEYYALAERLREQEFREDASDDAPICRWTDGHVILDVMPTDSKILGFGNEWYEPARSKKGPDTFKKGAGYNFRQMYPAPFYSEARLVLQLNEYHLI